MEAKNIRAELIKKIKKPSHTKSHTPEADTNRRQAFSSGLMDTLEPLKGVTKTRHFGSGALNGWKDSAHREDQIPVANNSDGSKKSQNLSIDPPSKWRITRAIKKQGEFSQGYDETSKIKNDLRSLSHSYAQTLDKASEAYTKDQEPKLFKKTYQAERMHTALNETANKLNPEDTEKLSRSKNAEKTENLSNEITAARQLAEQSPTQYIKDSNKDAYNTWKKDNSEKLVDYEKKQERWRQNGRQTGQVTKSAIAVGKAAGLAVVSGGIGMANVTGLVGPVITSGIHASVIESHTTERMKTLSMKELPADQKLKLLKKHDEHENHAKTKYVDSAIAVSSATGLVTNGFSIAGSANNVAHMIGSVGGELNQTGKTVSAGSDMFRESQNHGKSTRADIRRAQNEVSLAATNQNDISLLPTSGASNQPTASDIEINRKRQIQFADQDEITVHEPLKSPTLSRKVSVGSSVYFDALESQPSNPTQ